MNPVAYPGWLFLSWWPASSKAEALAARWSHPGGTAGLPQLAHGPWPKPAWFGGVPPPAPHSHSRAQGQKHGERHIAAGRGLLLWHVNDTLQGAAAP